MPHLFEPLNVRGVTLKNRIMMAPMCQYSAGNNAVATDWHYLHYATRAVGGAGLIMVESTAVEDRGRADETHLGIYGDRHVESLGRLTALCHEMGSKVGLQIVHAGRRAWTDKKGWGSLQPVAPSAVPFADGWNTPHALTQEEIENVINSFRQAAAGALKAGFDVLEIHAAHGYLINEFLSPIANRREDEYGGTLDNRMRFLHRVLDAVREVWPEEAPLFVRISATDWMPGGMGIDQMIPITKTFAEHGVDLVDVSSGFMVPDEVPVGPGYMIPFAERIKKEVGIPTAAVGVITTPELADEVIRNHRADIVAMGKELLRNPYWPLQAASALGVDVEWPGQYRRAKR